MTIIERCRHLAGMSEDPFVLTRTFLSPPVRDVHRSLTEWMNSAGMSVSIDAAGNLRGRYPGLHPGAPRLLIGSHIDTVPNAGAFDGPLGVMIGIALVEALAGRRFRFGALAREHAGNVGGRIRIIAAGTLPVKAARLRF